MSAVANAVPSASRTDPDRSIDELDAAICRLAGRINAVNYRLLVLVREFDDRMGWGEMELRQLRRVAVVALPDLIVRRAREGAHGTGVARPARDRTRVSRRQAVVHEGTSIDACRGDAR